MAAVRVELADHPVQTHPLVGERTDRGVAGLGQQIAERHPRPRLQAHRDGVAEVADDILGVAGAVEHRCRHQEVVGMAVAMHEHPEDGQ